MYNHTQPQEKCLKNSTDATVVLLIERNRDRYRKWLVRRDSLIWLWQIVTVEGRCDGSIRKKLELSRQKVFLD